jgi:hypothetical protein
VGKCACDADYVGKGCAVKGACPKMCSGHGECHEDGKCDCVEGFRGDDACSKDKPCPQGCSGHGKCQTNGTCICSPAYVGTEDCRDPEKKGLPNNGSGLCANNCSGHGECMPDLTCKCDKGFDRTKDCRGGDRGLPPPPPAESIPERVEDVLEGKTPPKPTERFCPNNCSGHGECQADLKCICDAGFEATSDCRAKVKRHLPSPPGRPNCPLNCNNHGICDDMAEGKGKCKCDKGFRREDQGSRNDCRSKEEKGDPPPMPPGYPAAPACPNRCSGHGECQMEGKCLCDEGFQLSADCSAKSCLNNCNCHGECISGKCSCLVGYDDTADCKKLPCPKDCSGHGTCGKGACTCDTGFAGVDCGRTKAPPPVIVEKAASLAADEDRIAANVAKRIKIPVSPAAPAPIVQIIPQPAKEDLATAFANKIKEQLPRVSKCKNDCNGHGTCLPSGKCQCEQPFTGSDDCAKAPTSLEECGVCCTYQCVNKCKPKLAEGGQASYLDCYHQCATGMVPPGSPFDKSTGVDQKDVEKYALDDLDGSAPAPKVMAAMPKSAMSLLEEHAAARSAMDRSGLHMLKSMHLKISGGQGCMSVCMSGQHPDVNFQCHKSLNEVMSHTSGTNALPGEIKTLVADLAKERYQL